MASSPASLLGLPPEIRHMIYDLLLFDGHRTGNEVEYFALSAQMYRRPVRIDGFSDGFSPERAIFCTNRQIRDEASEYMYSKCKVFVILAKKEATEDQRRRYTAVGKVDEMHLWRFVKHLQLDIVLRHHDNKELLDDLARLSEHALERGKYLKTLDVNLWFCYKLLGWYPKVAERLKQMRVRGKVTVTADRGAYREECSKLEDLLTGVKNATDGLEECGKDSLE